MGMAPCRNAEVVFTAAVPFSLVPGVCVFWWVSALRGPGCSPLPPGGRVGWACSEALGGRLRSPARGRSPAAPPRTLSSLCPCPPAQKCLPQAVPPRFSFSCGFAGDRVF